MLYNDASYDFARLQLYYEWSLTCINLPTLRRVLKCFPLFYRWLFADLVNHIRNNINPGNS